MVEEGAVVVHEETGKVTPAALRAWLMAPQVRAMLALMSGAARHTLVGQL